MAVLAINTASSKNYLAVIANDKVIAEINWRSFNDESEKLLPAIIDLLKKARITWDKLEKIVVVNGPGPFSSTRIGVTVANILSLILGIPVCAVGTTKIWEQRAGKDKIILLHAGSNIVYRSGAGAGAGISDIKTALKLPPKPLDFCGELTENEMAAFAALKKPAWKFISEDKLPSFGQTILKIYKTLKPAKCVEPKYWQPPHITKSHALYRINSDRKSGRHNFAGAARSKRS